MKKTECINIFTGGLSQDSNPLAESNKLLRNALNATLVTMNGDDYALQNDMGNCRVETAKLPSGYIPLGTTLLGGIIYIVSVNPSTNECLIGSFPSPERNIEMEHDDSISFNITELQENGQYSSKTIYKEISNVVRSGDKFLIYSGTDKYDKYLYKIDNISDSSNPEEWDRIMNRILDIDIVTNIDGQLKPLSNLKLFNGYKILYQNLQQDKKPDLDEYRSLVEHPYNIYQDILAGKLNLKINLIQPDDFLVLYPIFNFINDDIDISALFEFIGNKPFIPKGVKSTYKLYKLYKNGNIEEEPEIFTFNCDFFFYDEAYKYQNILNEMLENYNNWNGKHTILINNFLQEYSEYESLKLKIKEFKVSNPKEEFERIIECTHTPIMNWGEISSLSETITFNINKINSGDIVINTWKYQADGSSLTLKYNISIYLIDSDPYTEYRISFYDSCNNFEQVDYVLKSTDDDKTFNIELNQIIINESLSRSFGSRSNYKGLFHACLYLAKIDFYKGESISKSEYRFIYTDGIFNNFFNSSLYKDFGYLNPNISFKFEIEDNSNLNLPSRTQFPSNTIWFSVEPEEVNNETPITKGHNNVLEILDKEFTINIINEQDSIFSHTSINPSTVDYKINLEIEGELDEIKKGNLGDQNFNFKYSELSNREYSKEISKIQELLSKDYLYSIYGSKIEDNKLSFKLYTLSSFKNYFGNIYNDYEYKYIFTPIAYDIETYKNHNVYFKTTKGLSYAEPYLKESELSFNVSITGNFGFGYHYRDVIETAGHEVIKSVNSKQDNLVLAFSSSKDILNKPHTSNLAKLKDYGWEHNNLIIYRNRYGNSHSPNRILKRYINKNGYETWPCFAKMNIYNEVTRSYESYVRNLSIQAADVDLFCPIPINFGATDVPYSFYKQYAYVLNTLYLLKEKLNIVKTKYINDNNKYILNKFNIEYKLKVDLTNKSNHGIYIKDKSLYEIRNNVSNKFKNILLNNLIFNITYLQGDSLSFSHNVENASNIPEFSSRLVLDRTGEKMHYLDSVYRDSSCIYIYDNNKIFEISKLDSIPLYTCDFINGLNTNEHPTTTITSENDNRVNMYIIPGQIELNQFHDEFKNAFKITNSKLTVKLDYNPKYVILNTNEKTFLACYRSVGDGFVQLAGMSWAPILKDYTVYPNN